MNTLPPLPEELKFISPFLQRGQELQKREPIIAYHCNYCAAKLAIGKGHSKESKAFLVKLLDVLEAEKKSLGNNEAVTNDVAASAYVENFALKVFLNADNEDRAGKATKKTAQTFLAASLFLELLKIFGDIDPEIEEKIKYSKWKAINIVKAINNGQTPVPGPPGGETENADQQTKPYALGIQQNEIPSIDQFPSAPLSPSTNVPADNASDNWTSPRTHSSTHSDSLLDSQDITSQFGQLNINPQKTNEYYGGTYPVDPEAAHQYPSLPSNPTPVHVNPPPSHGYVPATPNSIHFDQNQQPPQNTHIPPFNNQTLPSIYQQPTPHGYYPPHQPTDQPVSYPLNNYSTRPASPHSQRSIEIDANTIALVKKHSKWAVSALDFNDVKTAINNLREALAVLEPYNTA